MKIEYQKNIRYGWYLFADWLVDRKNKFCCSFWNLWTDFTAGSNGCFKIFSLPK